MIYHQSFIFVFIVSSSSKVAETVGIVTAVALVMIVAVIIIAALIVHYKK